MALLTILKYPHPMLGAAAPSVLLKEDWKKIKTLTGDMFETMHFHRGIGLAAPQVNVFKRVIVVNPGPGKLNSIAMVNPEIFWAVGASGLREGCLSFPGKSAVVERPSKIRVRWRDLDQGEREGEFEGLMSHCIQHEIDHLNGYNFVDRIGAMQRREIVDAMIKESKR